MEQNKDINTNSYLSNNNIEIFKLFVFNYTFRNSNL